MDEEYQKKVNFVPMDKTLPARVKQFLHTQKAEGKVLLGYSGGPDSKALLYLLLASGLELHVAHVDHGWREESRKEAEEIAREVKGLGLPFHLLSLSRADFATGNWEQQGREYRLNFFSKVYRDIGARSLILGHHADDQAEVVLKRVLEGASLFSMGGLTPVSQLRGMEVWRPLLFSTKKEVLSWVQQNNLSYLQDPTNLDPRFLRGRMRAHLFPTLQEGFGKQISGNLCLLGEHMQEIQTFFLTLNAPILASVRSEDKREVLDLNPFLPLSALQVKYLLRQWFAGKQLKVSREMIEGIVSATLTKTFQKEFLSNRGRVQVDKGVLFLFCV